MNTHLKTVKLVPKGKPAVTVDQACGWERCGCCHVMFAASVLPLLHLTLYPPSYCRCPFVATTSATISCQIASIWTPCWWTSMPPRRGPSALSGRQGVAAAGAVAAAAAADGRWPHNAAPPLCCICSPVVLHRARALRHACALPCVPLTSDPAHCDSPLALDTRLTNSGTWQCTLLLLHGCCCPWRCRCHPRSGLAAALT